MNNEMRKHLQELVRETDWYSRDAARIVAEAAIEGCRREGSPMIGARNLVVEIVEHDLHDLCTAETAAMLYLVHGRSPGVMQEVEHEAKYEEAACVEDALILVGEAILRFLVKRAIEKRIAEIGVPTEDDHCEKCGRVLEAVDLDGGRCAGCGTMLLQNTVLPPADEEDEIPPACECDNGHKQAGTVCRFCWAHGRRKWDDPEYVETVARR